MNQLTHKTPDRTRRARRLPAAVAASCESLEQRRLLSMTTFSISPALSTLTLTTKVTYDGLSSTVGSQGSSSLNSSQTSLTTEFSGTLQANVGTGTLQFVAGSSINALVNGNWKPGDNPGGTNNASMTVAADFGGKDVITFVGTEYTALRNLVFDASSPVLNASSGKYTTDGLLQITATQGQTYYDGVSELVGGSNVTGDYDYDGSGQQASLQTTSSTETLTVPISINFNESGSGYSITSTFVGTVVATAALPSASATLKLDADGVHLDLNTSAGASVQFIASQTNYLSLPATGGAGAITIDNSAGNAVIPGGLNITGDGSTTLALIGSGSGDSITQTAGQILFNSNPINFTGITAATLKTNGGSDALNVNAGQLNLITTANLDVLFSSISIGSGAEFQVPAPSSYATRALLTVGSLTIAGSTGNWTGTLDLTENEMDLQTGSLATVSNMAASGWQGLGLASSTALANTTHLTTLGVIQNNQSGTAIYGSGTGQSLFDGQAPGAADILIKYTYFGDTNLNGTVDGSNYTRVDSGHLSGKTGWFNGDFNYDGYVNGTDYTLIDNAFNTQGSALPAALAASEIERSGSPMLSASTLTPTATDPLLRKENRPNASIWAQLESN